MAKTERRLLGDLGESLAARFLERKGFRILERNYQRKWGEIDIIAEKAGIVRFVEVKTLSHDNQHVTREMNDYRPEEMVHQGKLKKIARTAEMYMNGKGDPRDYQVDVVGVLLNQRTRRAHCRLFEQVL